MTIAPSESSGCAGYCPACATIHRLPEGRAREMGRRLYERIEAQGTIDLFAGTLPPDPGLSTAPLFGDQRGKMFGLLECRDKGQRTVWLHGFSGQFNGRWVVPGWAPPLFDVAEFARLHDPVERQIKALGREIDGLPDGPLRHQLMSRRLELSRRLMRAIHRLYRLHNCSGASATLDEVCGDNRTRPTGIGDCCAPKLLNQAARQGLRPVSLAEFYYGRPTRSDSRRHGRFYAPCPDKCRPLLGFLLCGAA